MLYRKSSFLLNALKITNICKFSNKGISAEQIWKRFEKPPFKPLPIAGVQNVVLIYSAKGGVGKSTVAVNTAIALSSLRKNKSIGILDADIFGPSVPKMMNLEGAGLPELDHQNFMLPHKNFGIQCMSLHFLTKGKEAIVWRGPIVVSCMNTLLRQVNWGLLDILIIDMPPGTSDVQLSVCQSITVSGSIIVSTSQDVALIDAIKGVDMFNKMRIKIIGLVQNMSVFKCPHCKTSHHLFGQGDKSYFEEKINAPLITEIPLDPEICKSSDSGKPIVVSDPDSTSSIAYNNIARSIFSHIEAKENSKYFKDE